MAVTVKVSGNGLDKLHEALSFLKARRVMIGIPQSNAAARGDGLTNVDLAYIHSNGSPRLHIPARPFLEPALAQQDTQDRITGLMKDAMEQAMQGDFGASRSSMDAAGQVGEDAAKRYFTEGHFEPNAPITINGGWMRNRISGKPFYVEGKGSSAPLIDTGSLRGSITHVIEGE